MRNLKVICDSLSDVPDYMLKEYNIEMIPLTLILDEKEYRDRLDITIDDFYRKLREEDAFPKTSQITYATFRQTFEKYLKEGNDILYISGSAAATGTYQSAMLAKEDLENIEGEIYIFDTNQLSFGAGEMVYEAGKMASENKTIEEILDMLKILREKIYVIFSVDTLDYLQKGGRISSTKAAIGNILNIKPILEIKDGLVSQLGQVRGKKHVVSKLIDIVRDKCGNDLSNEIVYIGYTDDTTEREQLKKILLEEFRAKEVVYFQIGSCIGAHSGPGATGLILRRKN
ncbi:MAG: DegV family protein [Clostridioides sp.]|jgi:DegV family protein with EDD domain|nr:DegV family protein [Clostridioides sp.]